LCPVGLREILKTHSLKPDLTLPIIPCNKDIGMTNYPIDEESTFKNEK